MKFVRFSADYRVYTGVLENESIKVIEGNLFTGWKYNKAVYSKKNVKILAPLEPNQIIGIGANYVAKEEDLPKSLPEIPVFFFKPTSSVIGTGDDIVLPHGIDKVKFESELAVIIGKEGRFIPESDVSDYVFGYTIGNDVTAPQFFHEDGHWTIGKSFDTFTPLGPAIETELDPAQVKVKARLNNDEKQNSGTMLMIFSISKMISYLSTVMTLKPGDVILSGSPLGAELIGAKDMIECVVDQIGILRNRIVSTG